MPKYRAMAHREIVSKHGRPRLLQFFGGGNLEFNFNASLVGQHFSQVMQFRAVSAFVEKIVPAQENPKLHVVVGCVSIFGAQHTAFTPAVASTQVNSFQLVAWNNTANTFGNALT